MARIITKKKYSGIEAHGKTCNRELPYKTRCAERTLSPQRASMLCGLRLGRVRLGIRGIEQHQSHREENQECRQCHEQDRHKTTLAEACPRESPIAVTQVTGSREHAYGIDIPFPCSLGFAILCFPAFRRPWCRNLRLS